MWPAKSCGFTIQKIVLSVSSGAASRVVSMVTSTLDRSGDTAIAFTVPIVTSLNLSCDWPAVRPPADSKDTVMVGPRLEYVSQASHSAISAVTAGTSQTSGTRRRRRTPAVGRGAESGLEMVKSSGGQFTRPSARCPSGLEPERIAELGKEDRVRRKLGGARRMRP